MSPKALPNSPAAESSAPAAPGACRLCGSRRTVGRHEIRGVRVERCGDCGFVQVRDRPTAEDYAKCYAPAYFDHGKYTDTFALRKENDRRLALIRRTGLARGARLLDAGCATGNFLQHVGSEFDLWGLDISEFAVEEARRKNPSIAGQIHAGPLEDQDYAAGFFDAVAMWDVLEHLWDPVDTCRRLLNVLRPGGYLFLSTPNIGSIPARAMGRYWAFMTVPEHLGFFSRCTMEFLVRQRLGLEWVEWRSQGKWVNGGFLLYKVKRVAPWAMPQAMVNLFRAPGLRRLAAYVPTGDIQYVVARKGASGKPD